jgi:hypothetical protein
MNTNLLQLRAVCCSRAMLESGSLRLLEWTAASARRQRPAARLATIEATGRVRSRLLPAS